MVAPLLSGLNRLSTLGGKIRSSAETVNTSTIGQRQREVAGYYDILRAYYHAEIYERADINVAAIKAWEGLPRYIRPIVLVPRRAVEWWPGHVFPGAWTWDGNAASNGRPNMVAYDRDTPEDVRLAVQTGLTWGSGPRFLRHFARTGAMLGNAFAKVEIDTIHGEVYPSLIDPSYVVETQSRANGKLTYYRLAIPRYDEIAKRGYLYGEEATPESFTTFYDDAPHSFVDGQPATIPNPFGFVPAVFPSHVATSGPIGASAIDGTLPLLDELNGVISQIDDYLMRIVNQSVIVESPDPAGLARQLRNDTATTRTPTEQRTSYQDGRQQVPVLAAPTGTNVHHLLEDIGLAASESHIMRLEREIEKTFPEIVLSDKLLEMSQVTRPGAVPLVQDVQHKFDESAGNYYDAIVTLGQMLCTMGGFLANSGAWGLRRDLTDQQQQFLPFDLRSFDRGDLAFSIVPGDLIPKGFGELAAEAIQLEQLTTAAGLEHVGFSESDIYGAGNEPAVKPGILEQKTSTAPQTPPNGSGSTNGAVPVDSLAANPDSAAAFFARHVPPSMRANGAVTQGG